jgi:hypothetical protein
MNFPVVKHATLPRGKIFQINGEVHEIFPDGRRELIINTEYKNYYTGNMLKSIWGEGEYEEIHCRPIRYGKWRKSHVARMLEDDMFDINNYNRFKPSM